jgi:RHS repeat-associated protein
VNLLSYDLSSMFMTDSSACSLAQLPPSLQKFTGKERDAETGLDYFGARYLSSAQGRFITPDPAMKSAFVLNPQTWNRYTYVMNNPLRFIDPHGLWAIDKTVIEKNYNVVISVKQSKAGDNYTTLANQLGFTGKAADKIVAQLTKTFGADGNNLQLSNMKGNRIGSTFGAAEDGLKKQAQYDAKGGGNTPGPQSIENGDCSYTAIHAVLGNLMNSRIGNWMGISSANEILQNRDKSLTEEGYSFKEINPGSAVTGDIYHWDGGGNRFQEHFASFLMFDDNMIKPTVFSRSGDSGRYEVVPATNVEGYGIIDKAYHLR